MDNYERLKRRLNLHKEKVKMRTEPIIRDLGNGERRNILLYIREYIALIQEALEKEEEVDTVLILEIIMNRIKRGELK